MLKYGLRSRINAAGSFSQKKRRTSSICAPDAVSISSRHRRISDIKNPDTLVLEITPPLSPSEVFSNSSVLSSPSAIIHHNNSYTNLPAIPEFPANNPMIPANNPMTEPSSSDTVHHVRPMSRMMPSIPENLVGAGTRMEEVLTTVSELRDGNTLDVHGGKYMQRDSL